MLFGLPRVVDSGDHYAQVVTERGEAAAKAMGRRFLSALELTDGGS